MPVAEAYLAIYTANPKAPNGDESLYNAGVSFEQARSIASATQMFDLLRKQYPHSALAPRATGRLGKLYGDISMYDRAAEILEEYAKKYAGEKDAYDAMSDAVYYRKATGNRVKAIEDTKYFVKAFGSKRVRESADAMWSLTALYDGDDAIKHLREYLTRYSAKGGAGRLVIAHAKIGQLLLKQSCSVRPVDGLCVTQKLTSRTCGKGMTTTYSVTARNQRKVAEARKELEQAIHEYERNGMTDDPEARYFYAQAHLARADLELEAYLTLAPAKNLDAWIEQKQKAAVAVNRSYETVLATKDAASSISAAARLGMVTQAFAASLMTGSTQECDKRLAMAEPLEAKSVTGFGVCLAKSTELSWFSDSSALCERELARIRPDDFPLAHELRGEASHYAPVLAAEPALR